MIVGNRVYLRALEPTDLELLFKWENDPRLWKVSRMEKPISQYALKQYLQNAHLDIQEVGQVRLVVCLKENNAPIGLLDLFDYEAVHRRAGVGLFIYFDYQKLGFGKEVLNLCLNYAKNTLHLHQLHCLIHEGNVPSLQLFEQAGFVSQGVKKDWIFVEGKYVDELFFQKIL